MLDAGNYRQAGYISLAIFIPLLLLVFWNIKKGLERARNSENSPIMKNAARYGDINQISTYIENEMSWQDKLNFSKCYLTKSWFIKKTLFNFNFARYDRIAWVYKKVTSHSVNFIPTGKTYGVILNTQYGESFELKMVEKEVNLFLETLANRAPWIIFGYNNELKYLWDKNRIAFIEALESRKAKITSAS